MANDIVDILNQGLRSGGVPLRIADYYEGSEAAKTALEIYGQSRDELIRTTDWSFSRGVLALTLLKGPPPDGGFNPIQPWSTIYPPPGFLYEYAYPGDCLDLRAIIAPPGGMPDLDPLPALFRVDNDAVPVVSGSPPVASGPPAKVILCNMTNAIGVYRRQVTDVTQWEPGFTASLIEILGKKFAIAFGADANTNKMQAEEANAVTQTASGIRG
jgi:hypothetical protein